MAHAPHLVNDTQDESANECDFLRLRACKVHDATASTNSDVKLLVCELRLTPINVVRDTKQVNARFDFRTVCDLTHSFLSG